MAECAQRGVIYTYGIYVGGFYAEPRKSRVAILLCRRRAISRNLAFAFAFSCISVVCHQIRELLSPQRTHPTVLYNLRPRRIVMRFAASQIRTRNVMNLLPRFEIKFQLSTHLSVNMW